MGRIEANLGKPIPSLFMLPRSGSMKTELVFIERCLDLLAPPGGRMGVVLPEGIFNNPSLQYVREFTEDRAFLRAVVSLSQDTFISSGASVKCSILFLEKFTEEEEKRFHTVRNKAIHDITKKHQPALDAKRAEIAKKVASASAESSGKDAAKAAATLLREQRAALKKELAEFE